VIRKCHRAGWPTLAGIILTEDAPPAAHFGGWATAPPQATVRTFISARSGSFTTTGPGRQFGDGRFATRVTENRI